MASYAESRDRVIKRQPPALKAWQDAQKRPRAAAEVPKPREEIVSGRSGQSHIVPAGTGLPVTRGNASKKRPFCWVCNRYWTRQEVLAAKKAKTEWHLHETVPPKAPRKPEGRRQPRKQGWRTQGSAGYSTSR